MGELSGLGGGGFINYCLPPEPKKPKTECWNCSAKIEPNQKYCEKCGVEIDRN